MACKVCGSAHHSEKSKIYHQSGTAKNNSLKAAALKKKTGVHKIKGQVTRRLTEAEKAHQRVLDAAAVAAEHRGGNEN